MDARPFPDSRHRSRGTKEHPCRFRVLFREPTKPRGSSRIGAICMQCPLSFQSCAVVLLAGALSLSIASAQQAPPPQDAAAPAGPAPAGPPPGRAQGPPPAPQAPPLTPAAIERAEQILAEAHKAMGGDKLKGITSILVTGQTRRVRGDNL